MIRRVLFIALSLWIVGSFALADERPRRPNVLILLADDLGYGELGCYGGKEIPTPHLDALAGGGVRFRDGYVTAPFCAASRAGMLTGRYQTRFGFEFNPIGATNEDPTIGLPGDESTFADRMRDAGYVTGLLGKWHLGGTAKYHPQRRGFDEFYGFLHEGHYFVPPPWQGTTTWLRRRTLPDGGEGRWTSRDGRVIWSTHMGYHEPDYDANNPLLRNSQPIDEQAHLTDALTREATGFIERHQDQPFLLLVAYNAVHSPMQGADRYMRRFESIDDMHRRIFAAMLAHLDDSVGGILDTLRECDLERDTLVVFLSDNGGPTRELTSSNLPLRGEKGQLYEGGIRIPYILRWPGRLPAGRVDHRPVTSLDLLPTALAAAGAAKGRQLPAGDGVDLLPFLEDGDEARPHEDLYWRVGAKAALRHGDWKLVRDPRRGADAGTWELYNLADDISESKNLAEAETERLEQLTARWKALDAQMIEPLWGGRQRR
ncbi:MAG: sulfatase-like hydrolase/transferase [Pirellulaceae bacterium]